MKRHWHLLSLALSLMLALGCGASPPQKPTTTGAADKPATTGAVESGGDTTKLAAEPAAPQLASEQTPAKPDSAAARVIPPSINRKDGFDAATFHYAHQGSGFFPMSVVRALIDSETGEPYLKNLERFGLVPGDDPNGFPVGIVTNEVKLDATGEKTLEMFGFTCAACHTSDIRYKDKVVRIEGGSGLFYVDALGDAIAASLEKTLHDKQATQEFIARLLSGMSEERRELFRGLADFVKLAQDNSEFGHEVMKHLQARLGQILKDGAQAGKLDQAKVHAVATQLLKLARPEIDLEKLQERLHAIEGSLENLKYRMRFLKSRAWISHPGNRLAGGYGRADDFGTARVELFGDFNAAHGTEKEQTEANLEKVNAPVSTPPLWNIEHFAWLHWNANTNSVIQRSMGEAIGVGATFKTSDHTTSVDIVNQMRIEQQIPRIAAPQWPEDLLGKIDESRRQHGADLYQNHCARCHDPSQRDEQGLLVFDLFTVEEIGTDPAVAINFSKPVFQAGGQVAFTEAISGLLKVLQSTARTTMKEADQNLMDELEKTRLPVKWRDPLKEPGGKVYPAKPLDGIWATAPYLHNGSVPTLFHLLKPAKDRPRKFVTGSQDFLPDVVGFEWDPETFPAGLKDRHNPQKKLFLLDTSVEGNLNTGHEYSNDWSDDDRWALVEYLKVHKTPALSDKK